ncbi:MAG: transposase, partial [Bacteroidota bacterium]
MFKYPPEFSEIISVFSPLFSKKVFEHAGQLLLGAILTCGKRTVCGILRTLGLKDIRNWSTYHRVLSRTKWSALQCARCLLQLLIKRFVGGTTLVLGIDETIERRWGPKLKARGIYRDAVRSSKSHFVKCSGLRWIVVMVLCPV